VLGSGLGLGLGSGLGIGIRVRVRVRVKVQVRDKVKVRDKVRDKVRVRVRVRVRVGDLHPRGKNKIPSTIVSDVVLLAPPLSFVQGTTNTQPIVGEQHRRRSVGTKRTTTFSITTASTSTSTTNFNRCI
jgi:hypothetical protein